MRKKWEVALRREGFHASDTSEREREREIEKSVCVSVYVCVRERESVCHKSL